MDPGPAGGGVNLLCSPAASQKKEAIAEFHPKSGWGVNQLIHFWVNQVEYFGGGVNQSNTFLGQSVEMFFGPIS
jgi:hypothetical protein